MRFISDFKKKIAEKTVQILYESEDRVILNVKEVDPWILNTLVKTELLISYPVLVKNGKLRIEAITNRSKVDNFLTRLKKKDIKAKIERIGYYYKSTLLTQRQNEIVNLALKVSKSALSETLRRIFKKLANNYLNSSN